MNNVSFVSPIHWNLMKDKVRVYVWCDVFNSPLPHYIFTFTFIFSETDGTEAWLSLLRGRASWPGSCMPLWCAPAPRRPRSSGPSACLSSAPGICRSWRGGSTAPCTKGSRLAGPEQNPPAALAWETSSHTHTHHMNSEDSHAHTVFHLWRRTCGGDR